MTSARSRLLLAALLVVACGQTKKPEDGGAGADGSAGAAGVGGAAGSDASAGAAGSDASAGVAGSDAGAGVAGSDAGAGATGSDASAGAAGSDASVGPDGGDASAGKDGSAGAAGSDAGAGGAGGNTASCIPPVAPEVCGASAFCGRITQNGRVDLAACRPTNGCTSCECLVGQLRAFYETGALSLPPCTCHTNAADGGAGAITAVVCMGA
jgi:hypothetical protein